MALFVYFATRPRISSLGRLVGTVTYQPLTGTNIKEQSSSDSSSTTVVEVRGAKILRFEAPLFFANAESLRSRVTADVSERRVQRRERLRWDVLVLDFSAVSISAPKGYAVLLADNQAAASCFPRREGLI